MAAQPEGRQEKYVPAPPRKLFSPTQACRKLTNSGKMKIGIQDRAGENKIHFEEELFRARR